MPGWAAIALVAALGAEIPEGQNPRSEPPVASDLGWRFARCTAHFSLTSLIADRQGDAGDARRRDRLALGWRVAGHAVVRQSTDAVRTAQDEAAFDGIVIEIINRQVVQLKTDPVGAMVLERQAFEQICRPLVPLQDRIITLMKSSPYPQADI